MSVYYRIFCSYKWVIPFTYYKGDRKSTIPPRETVPLIIDDKPGKTRILDVYVNVHFMDANISYMTLF